MLLMNVKQFSFSHNTSENAPFVDHIYNFGFDILQYQKYHCISNPLYCKLSNFKKNLEDF